jgi:hypothetical protein
MMASEVQQDKLPMTGDASTLRPFGKAFYLKKAPYFVWTLEWIIGFTAIAKTFIVAFHTFPLLLGLHSAAAILYGWSFADRDYAEMNYSFIVIYFMILLMFLWTNLLRVVLWIVVELTAKWTLIGKRVEGRYNYDATSYAQRWEIYQAIAKVRKFSRLNFLDFFSGTPYMSAYFRWNGGNIGKDCCLYPSGADCMGVIFIVYFFLLSSILTIQLCFQVRTRSCRNPTLYSWATVVLWIVHLLSVT